MRTSKGSAGLQIFKMKKPSQLLNIIQQIRNIKLPEDFQGHGKIGYLLVNFFVQRD